MWELISMLLGSLLFIIFLLLIPIEYEFICQKSSTSNLLSCKLRVLNIPVMKIEFTDFNFSLLDFQESEILQYKTETENKMPLSDKKNSSTINLSGEDNVTIFVRLKNKIRMLLKIRIIRALYKKLRHINESFLKGIYIKEISWKIVYGFKDASWVGVSYGFLHYIQSIIYRNIKSNSDEKLKGSFIIIPVFAKTNLDLNFKCILNFRLGNIIITNVKIILFLITELTRPKTPTS